MNPVVDIHNAIQGSYKNVFIDTGAAKSDGDMWDVHLRGKKRISPDKEFVGAYFTNEAQTHQLLLRHNAQSVPAVADEIGNFSDILQRKYEIVAENSQPSRAVDKLGFAAFEYQNLDYLLDEHVFMPTDLSAADEMLDLLDMLAQKYSGVVRTNNTVHDETDDADAQLLAAGFYKSLIEGQSSAILTRDADVLRLNRALTVELSTYASAKKALIERPVSVYFLKGDHVATSESSAHWARNAQFSIDDIIR